MHYVDTTTLAIIITIALAGLGAYAALARYIWNQREAAVTKQIDEAKAVSNKQIDEAKMHHNNAVIELKAVAERLRVDELQTMELRGKLALLEQRHDGLDDDIKEIKREQVPRAEWERTMSSVNTQLRDIMHMLQQRPGYPSRPDSSSKNPATSPR